MSKVSDTFKLSNGYEIPCIGFGTWQINGDDAAEAAVKNAIGAGYRHIDTAAVYGNEAGVGKAVKNCGIKRDKVPLIKHYNTVLPKCKTKSRKL